MRTQLPEPKEQAGKADDGVLGASTVSGELKGRCSKEFGSKVKRVVVTSSSVAIIADNQKEGDVHSEVRSLPCSERLSTID